MSGTRDVFRRAAGIAVRLLRGGSAATFPVEQPTVFDLAVNLRTARELGLTLPRSIVLRADRVVE